MGGILKILYVPNEQFYTWKKKGIWSKWVNRVKLVVTNQLILNAKCQVINTIYTQLMKRIFPWIITLYWLNSDGHSHHTGKYSSFQFVFVFMRVMDLYSSIWLSKRPSTSLSGKVNQMLIAFEHHQGYLYLFTNATCW